MCSFSSETVDSVSSIGMQVDEPSPSSPSLSFKGENDHEMSSYSNVEREQGKSSILSVPLWTDACFAHSQDETLVFVYGRALVLAHTKHSKDMVIGVVLFNMLWWIMLWLSRAVQPLSYRSPAWLRLSFRITMLRTHVIIGYSWLSTTPWRRFTNPSLGLGLGLGLALKNCACASVTSTLC